MYGLFSDLNVAPVAIPSASASRSFAFRTLAKLLGSKEQHRADKESLADKIQSDASLDRVTVVIKADGRQNPYSARKADYECKSG